MFKIDKTTKTIHLTRGDHASFRVCLPIKDEEGHLKYQDNNDVIYWYNEANKIVYDSTYQKTDIDVKTLKLQLHTFAKDDVVRFKVFKAKNCDDVVLTKDTVVDEESQYVPVSLEKEITKIGEIISKETKYWYEVELNPDTTPQTIIGCDWKGPKIFMLYPEGDDK